MTIAENDINKAQREAAKDRAHSMCIDKIKQLSEWSEEASTQIQSLVEENIDLNEDNGNLRAEVRNLKDCLKQWQDSIEK